VLILREMFAAVAGVAQLLRVAGWWGGVLLQATWITRHRPRTLSRDRRQGLGEGRNACYQVVFTLEVLTRALCLPLPDGRLV